MSARRHIDVVQAIIDAWSRGDIDGVLDCVTDDIVYHYHVGSRPVVGKVQMRKFLERFGAGQTQIQWRILDWAEVEDRLLVEGVDDYVDAQGQHIRSPYMGAFSLQDGRVATWRDYIDLAIPAAARAGEPTPDWLEEIYRAPSRRA